MAILAVVLSLACSSAGWAALGAYSQDFEGFAQSDPNALIDDGWLVFGNVFDDNANFLFSYGPFGAPNWPFSGPAEPGFSALVVNEGGVDQGMTQLSVFSDYGCCSGDFAHFSFQGGFVEANVFQEQTIGPDNIGQSWFFSFDAKKPPFDPNNGNWGLAGDSTAFAFLKTIDPNNGFAATNFLVLDMTNTPGDWTSYTMVIDLLFPELEGQLLQFGFLTNATNFDSSTVIYDNIEFAPIPAPAAFWLFGSALGLLGWLKRRSA